MTAPENVTSALERAYRALILWDEERMKPRVDEQTARFQAEIDRLPRQPVEAFRAAARAETLRIALWFQENEEHFLREAVSYLGDEVLKGLEEEGVAQPFVQVILEALEETCGELRDRMYDIREAAGANDGPAQSSGGG
jgi:hypothetical protein